MPEGPTPPFRRMTNRQLPSPPPPSQLLSGPEMHAPTSGDIYANSSTQGAVAPQTWYQRIAGAIQNSPVGSLLTTGANIQNKVRGDVGSILNTTLPGTPLDPTNRQPLTVGDAMTLKDAISPAMTIFHASPFQNIVRPLAGESLRATGVGDQWQGAGLYGAQHPGVGRYYFDLLNRQGRYPRSVVYDASGIGQPTTSADQHMFNALNTVMNDSATPQWWQQNQLKDFAIRKNAIHIRLNDLMDDTSWDHKQALEKLNRWDAINDKTISGYMQSAGKPADSPSFLKAMKTREDNSIVRSVLTEYGNQIASSGGVVETKPGAYMADVPDSMIRKMLHLDQPLTSQPKATQTQVLDVVRGLTGKYASRAASRMPGLEAATSFNMPYKYSPNPEQIMKAGPAQPIGWDIYHTLAHATDSPQEVSDALSQSGIPGNKYLDKGSRESMQSFIESFRKSGIQATPAELRDKWFKINPDHTNNVVIFDPTSTIRRWEPVTPRDNSPFPSHPSKKWIGK